MYVIRPFLDPAGQKVLSNVKDLQNTLKCFLHLKGVKVFLL